jgi:HPt (histidine-containing phosphotransfer) domain-containing protein
MCRHGAASGTRAREIDAVPNPATDIVDLAILARARQELGVNFTRMLGYFRDDGWRSLLAIEEAMRAGSAAALVKPAHTLKGEALQFGARPLAELAELIEDTARRCVEDQEAPNELVGDIIRLRPLFEATVALFDREASTIARRQGFGRRMPIAPGYGQR